MYCPKCRAEYRPDIRECGHCHVALVAELPPEDAFGSIEAMARALEGQELVPLVTGNLQPLREVQRFLASQRIASVIADDPETAPAEAAVHQRILLLVASVELERAKTALEQRWKDGVAAEGLLTEATAPKDVEVCPACGSNVAVDLEECPDCGLFVGAGAG